MSTTETASKRKLRLIVEYDGTDFAGFQWQGDGQRTVQSVLETAIGRLSGEFCRVHGAGRTDAGVHATGQVVHFETKWMVPVDKAAIALNAGGLPGDLTVRECAVAEWDFHARFSATGRTYRYTVLNRPTPSALLGRFAWQVREPLNLPAMRTAAAELTGSRDFAAFGTPNQAGQSTIRRMEGIDIAARKDSVRITVRGNAFLKHQVRAFVGTLVQVGLGRMTVGEVCRIRDSRDRTQCAHVAPPHGLCLVRVDYDGMRPPDGSPFEMRPETGQEQEL